MKKTLGISIIETLLLIVASSLIVIMGIRQYISYRLDADVTLIKYNTDALFSALSSYFQANCSNKSGLLSPVDPPSFVALSIQTDLIEGGYFNANQLLEVSLLLEGTSGPTLDKTAAYQVRFVPTVVPRYRALYNPLTGGTYFVTPPSQEFVMWQPEVMVIIKDPTKTAMLQALTQANSCTQVDWTPVASCDDAPALRFTHQVSFVAHSGTGSSYWTTLPSVGQLRDQEENYGPMVGIPLGGASGQYYLCGG